jgi:hypothetical protein
MSLDNALWLGYIAAEAVVIALLLLRRAWRLLPTFCIYCVCDLLINIGNYPVRIYFPDSYLNVYLTETSIDSVLQFCVLVELAWSVLRPIRASLPRASLFVIAGMILAVGAAIWPFSDMSSNHGDIRYQMHILLHLLQTVSILRILFFLGLAGCSQLLSLSWRDRELQVVTGLGLYSIVSLGVSMFHTHQPAGAEYGFLNQFVVISYICSLLYWVICFSQREAERQEFTPQMQNLLLAVAGVARADREALARKSVTDGQNSRRF